MGCADEEAIRKIVLEMTKAQTAADLMRTWSNNVVWFDTINYAVKGYAAVLEEYSKQFTIIDEIQIEVIDLQIQADERVGFAFSIQKYKSNGINGGIDHSFVFRETDCFSKADGEWKLVHQHVSLPVDFSTGKVVLNSDYRE